MAPEWEGVQDHLEKLMAGVNDVSEEVRVLYEDNQTLQARVLVLEKENEELKAERRECACVREE